MVVFFIHPAAQSQYHDRIAAHEQMEPHRRDRHIDDDLSEISDKQIDGIDQKQILHHGRISVDGIENGGHIGQKLHENCPEILDVTEKDKQCGKNQSHADVEKQQHKDRFLRNS